MKNFFLFKTEGRVVYKTFSLFLFLFTFLFLQNNQGLAQACSLVAQDEVHISVDQNCQAVIDVDHLLNADLTSCPTGNFTIIITKLNGDLVVQGAAPVTLPSGYAGQTLRGRVVDQVSGNQSLPTLMNITDQLKPTLECFEVAVSGTTFALTPANPTYHRMSAQNPPCDGLAPAPTANAVPYNVMEFMVTQNGNYTFDMNPGILFPVGGYFVALYRDEFDPTHTNTPNPCDNFMRFEYGANPAAFTVSLTVNTRYFLVTSSSFNGQYGQYSYTYTAPQNGRIEARNPDCEYEVYCYDQIEEKVILRAFDNCNSNSTITKVSETTTQNTCNLDWDVNIFRNIDRIYRATDASGNQSALLPVEITVLRLTNEDFYTNIRFPEDRTVLNGNAISCDEDYETTLNGCCEPSPCPVPEFAGVPYFVKDGDTTDLYPFPDMLCNLSATYIDVPVNTPKPNCNYKCVRIWTVTEWSCSSPERFRGPYIQTIEVVDQTGPEIECPDNVLLTTNTSGVFHNTTNGTVNCGSSFRLPVPAAEDNCQTNMTWNANIYNDNDIAIQFLANINWKNAPSVILPLGINTIEYIITDDCGNSTTCSFTVTVEDNTAPVAICQQFTVVAITWGGSANLPATAVNSGSYDDCQFDRVEIKRRERTLDKFAPFVTYTCEDIGREWWVIMRAFDKAGNHSDCEVKVEVQDWIGPTLTVPGPMTVACDFFYDKSDLATYFGSATADDNCFVTLIEKPAVYDINECGTGTLTRTFRATDNGGRFVEKSQTITFERTSYFGYRNGMTTPTGYGDIDWPENNMNIVGCIDPYNFPSNSPLHPEQSGYPQLIEGACDLVGFTYSDEVFIANADDLDTEGACFKVIRTWTIKDWCHRINGTFATWQFDQVLVVNNHVPPTFNRILPDTTVCTYDINCNNGYIKLNLTSTDECTTAENMKWQYKIDRDNDNALGVYDIVSPVYNGNQLEVAGNYPIGTHKILWIIWDQCGNKTWQEHLFTIQNCVDPVSNCPGKVNVNLSMVDNAPFASLDVYAEECCLNCSTHPCGYQLFYSWSGTNMYDHVLEFDCSDLGQNTVQKWTWALLPDGTFRKSYCTMIVEVQDNSTPKLCTGQMPTVIVSGNVEDERGSAVEGVTVSLVGSEFADLQTNASGAFEFPEMNAGGNYNLMPYSADDYTNGVSTMDMIHVQRHLLAINAINSPYKMIAADVNRDGKISAMDLLETRNLILGVSSEFKNNTSWRFINADYQFENEANPITESYPESELITNIREDVHAKFVAVKIGDLTNDASLNGLPAVETRNASRLAFELENDGFVKDQLIEVPVYAKDFNQINGFQYTLNYNAGQLGFAGVESGALELGQNNYFAHSEGMVTMSWSQALPVDVQEGNVLFTLKFTGKTNGELNENIAISSAFTKAEAYGKELEKMDVQMVFRNVETTEYELYQNTPNPFSERTEISFNMKEAGYATINVFDVTGKQIRTIAQVFGKGKNTVSLDLKDSGVNGVLYYQLTADGFTSTRKMIVVK